MSKPWKEMHVQLHKEGRGILHFHRVNGQAQPKGWQVQ